MRKKSELSLYLVVDKRTSIIHRCWASHSIVRRGKEIQPLEATENEIIVKVSDEAFHKIFPYIMLKAWEEDLYDEGNIACPYYPLIALVVVRYMYIKDNSLTFLPGHEPGKNQHRECFQYALQLYIESEENQHLIQEKTQIVKKTFLLTS